MSAFIGFRGSETDRFWAKVNRTSTCWLWTAGTDGRGYGQFYRAGNHKVKAHRYAYETLIGPIPDGLDLDHLCHNDTGCTGGGAQGCIHRRCVNPAHLEAVTRQTNLLRGATFSRAHHERRDCGFLGCVSCRHLARLAAA